VGVRSGFVSFLGVVYLIEFLGFGVRCFYLVMMEGRLLSGDVTSMG